MGGHEAGCAGQKLRAGLSSLTGQRPGVDRPRVIIHGHVDLVETHPLLPGGLHFADLA